MQLNVLYTASDPGTGANEDRAGVSGRFAWVIDGSTGVKQNRTVRGETEAARLAAEIDRFLRAASTSDNAETLETMLPALAKHLATSSQNLFEGANAAPHEAPCACLGLLEFGQPSDHRVPLRGAFIGDVSAIVPVPCGVERWTDSRIKPFEDRTLNALRENAHLGSAALDKAMNQIRENRARVNQPDGYFVVHPSLPWTDAVLRFATVIPADRPVVLATDGFLRLVDLYAHVDDEGVLQSITSGGGDALLRMLREIERQDPAGHRYVRVKPHDDATVLAVRFDTAARTCGTAQP